MRRPVTRLAVALVLMVAFAVATIAQSAATTVYVTRTGAKYHTASCRYLSRSQIPMALGEASKRFSPCSICRPPILGATATPAVPEGGSTRAAPPSKTSVSGQCQATTKKGTQCSRKAKAGGEYCWQHER
jgi:hypothetical protein